MNLCNIYISCTVVKRLIFLVVIRNVLKLRELEASSPYLYNIKIKRILCIIIVFRLRVYRLIYYTTVYYFSTRLFRGNKSVMG